MTSQGNTQSRPYATSIGLTIDGMSCASCVGRVERALRALPNIRSVNVNLATARADLEHLGDPDVPAAIAAVRKAGYEVATETLIIGIEGMSCASCVGRVERALTAVPGVVSASVNLATARAHVTAVRGIAEADLVLAVEQSGYAATLVRDDAHASPGNEAERRTIERNRLKRALGYAALLTLPVFVLEMGTHFVPGMQEWLLRTMGQQLSWFLQFVLTALVLLGPGARFFKKGIPALLRAAPDMNSMVAVGTGAAFAYSAATTFTPGVLPTGTANVYYEAAAVIVTLILLGRYFEEQAKGRTSEAIKRLVGLQPKTARVVRNGQTLEVQVDTLRVGDLIEVRPGERLPVDGEVVHGASFVDESMISGEAMPVEKKIGSQLIGGTVNQNGAMTFQATKIGSATLLSQIIRMVEQAQGAKLPIQAVVDRITLWFVPAVMAAALLTFVAWLVLGPSPALSFALVNAVAVLIIACPCAMGLATPTSIMVGTGRAAEMGILFRKGEALQRLRNARVVALDKTGTLTTGKPELSDLIVGAGFDRDAVLASMAAVEAKSEHPIARAIVAAAAAQGIVPGRLEGFEAVTGFGARAVVDGIRVEVGADRFMEELGLDVSSFTATAKHLGDQGKTPLYVAIGGKLAAIVAVSDQIKATTSAAIHAMHAKGLKVAMITGDSRHTAQAIARQLGIDEVIAEVLPAGKVDALRQLRTKHGTLAFVGDGINDAPALAEADVGLAIGTGTDIAIEAADVVLMSGDLGGVPNAIALSRATLRNINQNLFWAFAYNVALIPVAAGILYPINATLLSPMLAAGAMALSSIFVLCNALRLKRSSPPSTAQRATNRIDQPFYQSPPNMQGAPVE